MTKHEVVQCYPDDFFKDKVNELFVQSIMGTVLSEQVWRRGNPNKKEPDYFGGDTPFEFTLVSDRGTRDSYIKKLKTGKTSSDDMEAELLDYIVQSIESKARRKYCVEGVHLCLLSLVEMDIWTAEGLKFSTLYNQRRDKQFKKIKTTYICTADIRQKGKPCKINTFMSNGQTEWFSFAPTPKFNISFRIISRKFCT